MERVAAALFCLDLVILLAFLVPHRGLPVLARPLSDYGIGRTAGLFRLYVVTGSLAAPLLAWQVWSASAPAYPVVIPVYLLMVAVGRLGIGIFPNDAQGVPRTLRGTIHRTATLLAFACTLLAVVEATPILAATLQGPLQTVLIVLKHLVSAGFVAVMVSVSTPLRRVFGITERVFLVAAALWFLTASLALPPL